MPPVWSRTSTAATEDCSVASVSRTVKYYSRCWRLGDVLVPPPVGGALGEVFAFVGHLLCDFLSKGHCFGLSKVFNWPIIKE